MDTQWMDDPYSAALHDVMYALARSAMPTHADGMSTGEEGALEAVAEAVAEVLAEHDESALCEFERMLAHARADVLPCAEYDPDSTACDVCMTYALAHGHA